MPSEKSDNLFLHRRHFLKLSLGTGLGLGGAFSLWQMWRDSSVSRSKTIAPYLPANERPQPDDFPA
ncbi:MAG: hypothetical protein N5P05_001123 [Chroococcopsis gigantea SAG 12.99]|nr:hypothetical protein [Chroococcopsis gigantea SAG 12.99]